MGLLALNRSFSTDPSVLSFYWPFLFVATALIAALLYRGKIKRPEAAVLGSRYVIYWVLSYLAV